MMRLPFFLILYGLVSMGCVTSRHVSPDSSQSAISAGYPTAEFSYRNQIFLGLGEALLEKGQPLKGLPLFVKGYMQGTMKIESQRCNIHWSGAYKNSEKVQIPLEGVAEESCIIDVAVFPEFYDPETVYADATEGLRGSFFLKVSKNPSIADVLLGEKVPESSDVLAYVPVGDQPDDGEVEAFFQGCGSPGKLLKVPMKSSQAVVSAAEVLGPLSGQRTCVLEGGIRAPGANRRLTWQLAIYDPAFSPMPVPTLQLDDEDATVMGAPETAVILVNDEVFRSRTASFEIEKDKEYIIRTLSTKGRVSICILSQGGDSWSCQQ